MQFTPWWESHSGLISSETRGIASAKCEKEEFDWPTVRLPVY